MLMVNSKVEEKEWLAVLGSRNQQLFTKPRNNEKSGERNWTGFSFEAAQSQVEDGQRMMKKKAKELE